jgi:hypothetical protein
LISRGGITINEYTYPSEYPSPNTEMKSNDEKKRVRQFQIENSPVIS